MEVDSAVPAVAGDVKLEDGSSGTVKTEYKSWKKKYRKMRIQFEQKMSQSNALYKQEFEAAETAQRLAMENDQLLDVLLDLNNTTQIPEKHRIDLSSETPSLHELPPLIDSHSSSPTSSTMANGSAAAAAAKAEYAAIRKKYEERLSQNSAFKPSTSLTSLIASTPHLPFDVQSTTIDLSTLPGVSAELAQDLQFPSPGAAASVTTGTSVAVQPEPVGYLPPDRVDDQITLIDASLALTPEGNHLSLDSLPHNGHIQQPHLSDKEIAVRNPMSVYNWLRIHEPKIFLQDGESTLLGEKSLSKPGALRGAGKRASIPAPSKPDVVEFVEEDGLGYDTSLGGGFGGSSGNGSGGKEGKGAKRKRISVDDAGYNPKGGGTRPYKKKKKDGLETGGSGGRRSSTASKGKGKDKIAATTPAAAVAATTDQPTRTSEADEMETEIVEEGPVEGSAATAAITDTAVEQE